MNPIWHNLSSSKIQQILKTSKNGLTKEEAQKRLKKYGLNELPSQKRFSTGKIFIDQFKSPLVYVLAIAAIISFALKELTDATIILAAVLINATIGFFQENKAEKTFLRLKELVHYSAKVIREKTLSIIPNNEIVPGDIIILEAGDIVPADARLIETYNLQAREAPLTGESIPSLKKIDVLEKGVNLADRENMIYFGTDITRGKGKAIVVATGHNTELGHIANLIKETKNKKTPLQEKITSLAKSVSMILGGLCILLFVAGILRGYSFFEMLLTTVAVAVAAIPEGMAIAVTVCLAIGMQKILKKKALTKKLIAAETLGSITIIATDKTGTLTEGKMTVHKIIPYLGKTAEELFNISILCNDAIIENSEDPLQEWKIKGDTTETALLKAALQSGLDRKEVMNHYPRIDEIPFDSEEMYMATLHTNSQSNKQIIFIKGAPEKILEFCQLNTKEKNKIKKEFEALTKKGLRVLATASKKTNNKKLEQREIENLSFVGLIALKDPLRPCIRETIQACQAAGIRPLIITGDHKLTAQTIALEVGLLNKNEEILEGRDLDKISDEILKEKIKHVSVFARVEPKHKIRIVKLLQMQGEVVAMTGDGINDAPAIKAADIGIALGSGTEVTKETADIVLLDDNFKTIVEAIKTGRNIFRNIQKVIFFLLSGSFSEFILIGGALLFGFPLPVLAAQILWINIIEDTLPAMALSYEKEKKGILQEKAKKSQSKILNKEIKFLIGVICVITDLILFGLFVYFYKAGWDLNYIRTMIFAAIGFDSLFYIFSCKNLKKSIWRYNIFDNSFLLISVIFGFFMIALAVYNPFLQNILKLIPLNIYDWLVLISIGLFNLLAIELGKLFFVYKKQN
ncbi:HAD-IC family P-type ATPase [bacterium]|nr:HAD-IC family P-type ATPase [bacterium]